MSLKEVNVDKIVKTEERQPREKTSQQRNTLQENETKEKHQNIKT